MIDYRLADITYGLKKFPNGTFDMAYADPPYYHTTMTTKALAGDLIGENYWWWTRKWLELVGHKAKWGAHLYISFTIGYLWELMRVVKEINTAKGTNFFDWNGAIIWEYTNVGGPKVLGKVRRMTEHSYWYNYEVIVYLSKGKARPLNFCQNPDAKQAIWHIAVPQTTWKKETKIHPTQKPEELFRRLIEFGTNKGDFILDCFSGSGVMLLMAERMGRSAVGFDVDKRWRDEWNKLRKKGMKMKLEAF